MPYSCQCTCNVLNISLLVLCDLQLIASIPQSIILVRASAEHKADLDRRLRIAGLGSALSPDGAAVSACIPLRTSAAAPDEDFAAVCKKLAGLPCNAALLEKARVIHTWQGSSVPFHALRCLMAVIDVVPISAVAQIEGLGCVDPHC